jgi:hypothetical protein
MEIPFKGWIFGGAIVGGLAALESVARGENDLWHAVGLFLLLMAVTLAIPALTGLLNDRFRKR